MSIKDKLLKNSTIKEVASLTKSKVYDHKDVVPTHVPIINIALTGRIDGGITSGLTMIAGESKHFKTSFMLLMAAAYLKQYPDAMILFYDSEFGTPSSYVKSFGIDPDRVIHCPIKDVEEFKIDVVNQMEKIERGDKVIIIVDSIGNLASRKEIQDALEKKVTVDMTRAKQVRSIFAILTPHLTLKDIPMIVVNHVYSTIEMYSQKVPRGGQGPYLSADNIWLLSRQQDKDDKTKKIEGFDFIITVEKSRFVKEKSKFPVSVSYDEGIAQWSGLFDLALEGGYIVPASTKGWYNLINKETGEVSEKSYRRTELADAPDFWFKMFRESDFAKWIEDTYTLGKTAMFDDAELEDMKKLVEEQKKIPQTKKVSETKKIAQAKGA